jgi:hypothetical protein
MEIISKKLGYRTDWDTEGYRQCPEQLGVMLVLWKFSEVPMIDI